MVKEVRSPWSSERGDPDPHGMRGYSPGSQSSPSNAARSDSGHRAGHVGKSGAGLASLRRDNATVPVQGGWRSPVDPRE
jgi:hypothetical protein